MPARLPTVGGDTSSWGTVLNTFLTVAHNADGSLKNLFFNVKDPAYGAVGNGVTDDTTAIQAAINAAVANGRGVVFFPAAKYMISASLIVDSDQIVLVGEGQWGVTQIATTAADPTWALIIGNTKNVNDCSVRGLTFTGLSGSTSTGGGILLRGIECSITQCGVNQFGGHGISITAFSGSVFENYLDNLDLVQNGRNTTTPGDNLIVSNTVTDCEFNRIISAGDASLATTRNCINDAGSEDKYVNCHVYYGKLAGLVATGTAIQIIGGEYETNYNGIYMNGASYFKIAQASVFRNTNYDIVGASASQGSIMGTDCTSVVNQNIALFGSSQIMITDNVVAGTYRGIGIDNTSTRITVHDNTINSSTDAVFSQGTYCDIHDNMCTAGNITEFTGADYESIHHNTLYAGGLQTITKVGTHTTLRANRGYNPIGQVTAPTFPATTVAATNTTGADVTAYIANGAAAITVIQIAGVGGTYVTTGQQIAASGWGNIRIPAGGGVKFTYASGAPTWVWMGD